MLNVVAVVPLLLCLEFLQSQPTALLLRFLISLSRAHQIGLDSKVLPPHPGFLPFL